MTQEDKDKSVALFDKEVESFCKETFIKDEETKGLIFCCARHFTDWQKQRTIDNAYEWLKENIYNHVYKYNDSLGFPTATFLEEFRKAMEELVYESNRQRRFSSGDKRTYRNIQ